MIETSIVIPTKNGDKWIADCLGAVFSQQGVGEFEVVVVDSGSTDHTLEIVRRHPARIEQISAAEFHHARTRNWASGLAKGEFLVFLSQDAIPSSPRWLEAMLRNFEDLQVGAAYGRQVPREGSGQERHDALSAMYGSERIVKDAASKERLGFRYYHFSDANAAVRRAVWKSTGFPEDLTVFEDLGIAKRILDAGWKIVYEPEARVIHSHDHSTAGLFKRYFDIGYTFRRLDIWNEQTFVTMKAELKKLVKQKLRRYKNMPQRAEARNLKKDLAKSAGFWLGLHERYLPLAVKRRLSAHKLF